MIEKKRRNINRGKIEVALDNSKFHRGIANDIVKLCKHAQDAGAEVAQMRRLLKNIRFEVDFKLVRGRKTPRGLFKRKPLDHLIRLCDKEAK